MNTVSNRSESPSVLVLLQAAHSILNVAWPRPDCPQMAGAQVFIGTKVFVAVQNCMIEIDTALAPIGQRVERHELMLLWQSVSRVIEKLSALGKSSHNPNIDMAFNLLYLATGVLYHEFAHDLPTCPSQDARFAPVQEVAVLASQCKWIGDVGNIAKELTASLSQLDLG